MRDEWTKINATDKTEYTPVHVKAYDGCVIVTDDMDGKPDIATIVVMDRGQFNRLAAKVQSAV